jgi:hypothetical protein
MTKYHISRWDAIVLCGLSWLASTGLAAEKVWKDGVTSVTMLLAIPVLTLAAAVLIHMAVDKEGGVLKRVAAVVLAVLCLAVTMPASIGSSGGARDAAISQAEATNRGVKIAEASYDSAARDLADAKAGVRRECEGAPAVIDGTGWPKCQWWRRQQQALEFAMARFGKDLAKAPAEVVADSGEQRIAWLLSGIASRWGYAVTKADVQTVWPMLPPIAFELLCAFFLYAGLERREGGRKLVDNSQPISAQTQHTDTVVEKSHEPAIVGETHNSPPDPRPKRRTKRQQKREKGVNWARNYRARFGKSPPLEVMSNVLRVPQTTAHRWRKLAA